ncbi:MAG: NAD-dependent epimerase/dehydratase family protein [Solirubrobacteraceae bacterium]
MNCLVTGCAGFIGSHLTESLLQDRHRVIGVDCFNANYARREKLGNLKVAQEWDDFEFVPIDLARGDLRELVCDCDVVFHMAAEPGVRPSWGERFEAYLRNNVLATQLLLDALRLSPGPRLVYASSSSIYGDAECLPTPESVTPRPMSPYGATKLSGEHLCQLYHANHGIDAVSLRYFTVYGPRQRPDMAFNIFCTSALAGQSIEVFGDGTQTRDFTFVSDVVAATRAASLAAGVGGDVFNVGGGAQIALTDALTLIGELAGRPLDVRHGPTRSGDVKDTGADTSRAREKLAYRPSVCFEDGLREEFEWILAARVQPA